MGNDLTSSMNIGFSVILTMLTPHCTAIYPDIFKKQVGMTRTDHRPTQAQHIRETEYLQPHASKNIIKVEQLGLSPQQDVCKTQKDTKYYSSKQEPNTNLTVTINNE